MAGVILQGRLYGATRESDCEVLAWRTETDSIVAFTQVRVITAANDLPDGTYTLIVGSHVYSTDKHQGSWRMVRVTQVSA